MLLSDQIFVILQKLIHNGWGLWMFEADGDDNGNDDNDGDDDDDVVQCGPRKSIGKVEKEGTKQYFMENVSSSSSSWSTLLSSSRMVAKFKSYSQCATAIALLEILKGAF